MKKDVLHFSPFLLLVFSFSYFFYYFFPPLIGLTFCLPVSLISIFFFSFPNFLNLSSSFSLPSLFYTLLLSFHFINLHQLPVFFILSSLFIIIFFFLFVLLSSLSFSFLFFYFSLISFHDPCTGFLSTSILSLKHFPFITDSTI